jgi:serine protease inhibitor ecotin
MRRTALVFILFSLAGAPGARAAERVLSVEGEVLGPKDKVRGKTQVLVAARGTERAKGVFGELTLILDVDVGPTFDKDCNLVTVSGRLEDTTLEGKPRKRELTRTTVHACGATTKPATIPGGGDDRVVVTIRPAAP